MSELRARIDADIKESMKARDQVRLDTVRNIKSDIKVKEVSGAEATTLDDAGIIKVIQGLIKKRQDSAEQFRAAGREETALKEEREASILQAYLPKALSPAELEALVDAAIVESGAKTPKEMGAVIKIVQAKAAGRADGKSISELAKKKLGG